MNNYQMAKHLLNHCSHHYHHLGRNYLQYHPNRNQANLRGQEVIGHRLSHSSYLHIHHRLYRSIVLNHLDTNLDYFQSYYLHIHHRLYRSIVLNHLDTNLDYFQSYYLHIHHRLYRSIVLNHLDTNLDYFQSYYLHIHHRLYRSIVLNHLDTNLDYFQSYYLHIHHRLNQSTGSNREGGHLRHRHTHHYLSESMLDHLFETSVPMHHYSCH